jgi:hypothetical protein
METSQLKTVKDTIVHEVFPNFIKAVGSSATLAEMETATMAMLRAALSLVMPNKIFKVKDPDATPKSIAFEMEGD